MSPVRRLLALAGVVAVVAVAGCGIPVDGAATVHDPEDVPFGLLDEPAETPVPPPTTPITVAVYLVSEDDVLEPVTRQVPGRELTEVVGALLEGPTADEREAGLRTHLDGRAVGDVSLAGGVAAVDLDEDFATIAGTRQVTAIGQIVATLTARPGVGRVTFTLEGEPVEVPRGDGALTSGSVSRDAYRDLIDPVE